MRANQKQCPAIAEETYAECLEYLSVEAGRHGLSRVALTLDDARKRIHAFGVEEEKTGGERRPEKCADTGGSMRVKLSGVTIEQLSLVVSWQIKVSQAAITCEEEKLAALLTCQMFDLLDWSRLHLGENVMAEFRERVLSHLSGSAPKFTNLEQLEEYAEAHFIG